MPRFRCSPSALFWRSRCRRPAWSRTGSVLWHNRVSILVNGVGAAATGATLLVILVAKFAEGAWVMTLLIPLLLAVFGGVAATIIACRSRSPTRTRSTCRNIQPPIVILPMSAWNKMSQKGLRFALKLSSDIFVVQIRTGSTTEDDLKPQMARVRRSADHARRICRCPSSWKSARPTDMSSTRCIDYICEMKRRHPDRQIAVLIPELIARHCYEHLLHNKRAAMLKALLLVRGDDDVVVINVPRDLSD